MGQGEWPNWHNKFLDKLWGIVGQFRFDSLGNVRTRYTATAMVKWQTDTDFDKGSHSDTEAHGADDASVLRPIDEVDLDDDIPFTTEGNYTISDNTKVEVNDGVARLEAISGSEVNYPFTTPGNYTYDSDKIEVTGGEAKLKGAANIYAQWHMNESSGNTVDDASPNSYDGTRVNMEDVDWVSAHLNNGLRFNSGSSNEYVDCGNIANWERTQAFSGEAWIKTSTPSTMIMARHNGTTGWFLFITGDGKLFVVISNAYGSNQVSRKSLNPVTTGAWMHVCFTYDGSSTVAGLKVYLDSAEEAGATTETLTDSVLIGTNMRIGNWGSSNLCFVGDMDEVLLYDKELSSAEVAARYNSGTGTEAEGLATDDPTIVNDSGHAFTAALDTFTETATKPAGSGIKYHVSSDNGSTWKYWNGSIWTTTNDTYAQANTAADVHAQIGSLASSGTFKFRALLHSDGAANPELDNIYVKEPITYSTTDDLYLETKDAVQIDATNVITWLTTTFTETVPANTDIRVLFSNDGRSSWLTWSGSAWVAPTSATDRTDATSIADAEANIGDLAVGSNTLDVRIFLYTSDASVRPELDNINVTGDKGYATSAEWESNAYNSNQLSEDWLNVTFSGTVPASTSITVQARAANSLTELAAESYGAALSNGDDAGVTGKYIQFKVTFSGTVSARALLDWLAVTWETMDLPEVAP